VDEEEEEEEEDEEEEGSVGKAIGFSANTTCPKRESKQDLASTETAGSGVKGILSAG